MGSKCSKARVDEDLSSSADEAEEDKYERGAAFNIIVAIGGLHVLFFVLFFIAFTSALREWSMNRGIFNFLFTSYGVSFVASFLALILPCLKQRKSQKCSTILIATSHVVFSLCALTSWLMCMYLYFGNSNLDNVGVGLSGIVFALPIHPAIASFALVIKRLTDMVKTKPYAGDIYWWFNEQNLHYNEDVDKWLEEKQIKNIHQFKQVEEDEIQELEFEEMNSLTFRKFKNSFMKLKEEKWEEESIAKRVFHSKIFWKYVLGALLSYVLLILWLWTLGYFMYMENVKHCGPNMSRDEIMKDVVAKAYSDYRWERSEWDPKTYLFNFDACPWWDDFDCAEAQSEFRNTTLRENYDDFLEHDFNQTVSLEEHEESVKKYIRQCQYLYDGWDVVHNILFGLVTAVVVAQLASSDDTDNSNTTTLYARFAAVMEESKMEKGSQKIAEGRWKYFLWSFGKKLVLYSTRIYVITWNLAGAISLVFGAYAGREYAGPVFAMGQIWLGIAITATYTYFGVNRPETDEPYFGHDETDGNSNSDENPTNPDTKSDNQSDFVNPNKSSDTEDTHKSALPPDLLDKTDEYNVSDSDDDSSDEQDKEDLKTEQHTNDLGEGTFSDSMNKVPISESMYSARQSKDRGPWTVLQTGEMSSLETDNKDQEQGSV